MRMAVHPFWLTIATAASLLSAACRPPAAPPRPNATAAGSSRPATPEREAESSQGSSPMNIEKSSFGTTADGTQVERFRCTNAHGLVMQVMTLGATVVSLEAPDRNNKLENVTLSFDTLDGYLERHPYFGSTVGRFCNRIANARFTLDGQTCTLAANNGPHHLHGGQRGFDQAVWKAQPLRTDDAVGVEFRHTSPDGDEGYPGNLDVSAKYLLTNANEMKVELTATTDRPTPVNLTNHCYWNLAGARSGKVLDHTLLVAADQYVEVTDALIPTGQLRDVRETPLDFTEPQPIGARLEQLTGDPGGYDHCYVLRSQDGSLALAARAVDPASGRVLEVYTTQPGIQFYTGNFLSGGPTSGQFDRHDGFCLETQHYPDSPNQPAFPSTILRPGETYHQLTVHKLLVE